VLMFKAYHSEGSDPLVIQAQYNLSDERTDFLINDRLSFMRYLGLSLSDRMPAAKTIWLLPEWLVRGRSVKALFARSELGAAWRERAGGETPRVYLRVRLDDPLLPGPLSAALFGAADGKTAQLVWKRRRPTPWVRHVHGSRDSSV